MSDKKGCTKPDCFPYCDCGSADDYVPATPSEDGGEVPVVVGHRVEWKTNPKGSVRKTLADQKPTIQILEMDYPSGILIGYEELMTVAQHSRIVAAKDAEIARLKEDRDEWRRLAIQQEMLTAEAHRHLNALRAQTARQVGGDERTYEQGIQAAFDLVKLAACNTDVEQFASRLHDLADDIIEEAPTYKAQWKDITKLCAEIAELKRAALAPAAVVMPERRETERLSEGPYCRQ